MLGTLIKTVAVAVAAGVALPYTTAFLCNVLMGWPQRKDRFRRAFDPRKVYALNFAIIQKIMVSLKYAPEYLQWRAFYRRATSSDVIKNIPYGRNDNTLDLYLPHPQGSHGNASYPVVIFVYGGAWGSGEKNMYGLVCSAVAKQLGAIVCCPNHSTFPKGYVDDMVQDVVDSASWLYDNVHDFQGDKKKIMLVGHSSGAHLCAMSILELLHDEVAHTGIGQSQPPPTSSEQQKEASDNTEKEKTDGNESTGSGSSGSFCLVNDSDDNSVTKDTLESSENVSSVNFESGASMMESDLANLGLRSQSSKSAKDGSGDSGKPDGHGGEKEEEDSGDNDSVITVKQTDSEGHPSLAVLSKCIKGFVGLAGVYDISDHFVHESWRGVEDVSTMARAMYGEDHFQRFSPSFIVGNLQRKISLPKIMLVHGDTDIVVPVSSTTKFGGILEQYHDNVVVRIIPSCDHYEICLDLAKTKKETLPHFDGHSPGSCRFCILVRIFTILITLCC